MFPSTYFSLYTLNFPKYWLVRDKPIASPYFPEKEKNNDGNLLFQVSSGKYLSDLVARLRFFQETIYDRKTSPEMRMIQLKAIKATVKELLYLDKNFMIVPKDKRKSE